MSHAGNSAFRTAGVIGWPVAHSKSPLIHRFWLQKLGIDGDYSRFAIAPAHLAPAVGAFAALGLAGVNVTVPHKVAIIPHLNAISETAARVGAVNMVTVAADGRLLGDNSDVAGVLEALPEVLLPVGGRVCLIGSGGAARAALAAFGQRQVSEVHLLARDEGKGAALLAEFGLAGSVRPLVQAAAALQGAHALVNATTLGMHGQAAMPATVLAAVGGGAAVMDMVYAPLETALLATARRHALPAIDGLSMLIGQAASAFSSFFGQPPPRRHDDELRQRLLA